MSDSIKLLGNSMVAINGKPQVIPYELYPEIESLQAKLKGAEEKYKDLQAMYGIRNNHIKQLCEALTEKNFTDYCEDKIDGTKLLKAELETLNSRNKLLLDSNEHWKERTNKAEAELEKYRTALEFYADTDKSIHRFGIYTGGDPNEIDVDGGKRAREVLQRNE